MTEFFYRCEHLSATTKSTDNVTLQFNSQCDYSQEGLLGWPALHLAVTASRADMYSAYVWLFFFSKPELSGTGQAKVKSVKRERTR